MKARRLVAGAISGMVVVVGVAGSVVSVAGLVVVVAVVGSSGTAMDGSSAPHPTARQTATDGQLIPTNTPLLVTF